MSDQRRSPLIYWLVAILLVECALLGGSTLYLILELLTATPASYPSAIALAVLTAAATAWLALIAVHTLRGSPWIRGAAITWQVLQIAVAIGSFQGLFARPDIGWLLLVPALAAIALMFTRPVLAATTRPRR